MWLAMFILLIWKAAVEGANCISVYILFNQPTSPISVSCYDWKGFYFDLFPPPGDV